MQEVWKNHESATLVKNCPENSFSSAQAVLTSTPVSSPPQVAPPGLSTPVNSSANSENVTALEAILRDVLSPSGSSESARGRDSRLSPGLLDTWFVKKSVFAARDQTKHLSMIVDSGEEVHLVCPAHQHFLTNVTKLSVPLQLETAGGDLTLDVIRDLLCGGIVCHGCVFNPLLSVERCPEGYGVLNGRRGNVKLERSGGLHYLIGGEGQRVFPAWLTPSSVDGGYCRVDKLDIEHLRGGHLEFDPGCTSCMSMTMRGRQHRRQDDRETAGAGREVCADLTGRLPMAYNGSEYLLVALRRETRFGFVRALMNKRSETIKDAMIDMRLLLRGVWRFHRDEVREFMGAVDEWLREHTVLHNRGL